MSLNHTNSSDNSSRVNTESSLLRICVFCACGYDGRDSCVVLIFPEVRHANSSIECGCVWIAWAVVDIDPRHLDQVISLWRLLLFFHGNYSSDKMPMMATKHKKRIKQANMVSGSIRDPRCGYSVRPSFLTWPLMLPRIRGSIYSSGYSRPLGHIDTQQNMQ